MSRPMKPWRWPGNPKMTAMQLLGYKTGGTLITDKNMVVLDDRHLPWDLPSDEDMTEVITRD